MFKYTFCNYQLSIFMIIKNMLPLFAPFEISRQHIFVTQVKNGPQKFSWPKNCFEPPKSFDQKRVGGLGRWGHRPNIR